MLVTDNKTGPERYEPLLVKSALARQTLRRLALRAAAMSIPVGTAVTTKSDSFSHSVDPDLTNGIERRLVGPSVEQGVERAAVHPLDP